MSKDKTPHQRLWEMIKDIRFAMLTSWDAVNAWLFNRFKTILEMQLSLVKIKAVA